MLQQQVCGNLNVPAFVLQIKGIETARGGSKGGKERGGEGGVLCNKSGSLCTQDSTANAACYIVQCMHACLDQM